MLYFLLALNLIIVATYHHNNPDDLKDFIFFIKNKIQSNFIYYFGSTTMIDPNSIHKISWHGLESFYSTLSSNFTSYATVGLTGQGSILNSQSISGNNLIFSNGNAQITLNEIMIMKKELIALRQEFIETKYKHSIKIDNLENKKEL